MQVDVVIRPEDIYIFDVIRRRTADGDRHQLHLQGRALRNAGADARRLRVHGAGLPCLRGRTGSRSAGETLRHPRDEEGTHLQHLRRKAGGRDTRRIPRLQLRVPADVQGIEPGSTVQVEVDFQHVILEDNEEDGRLTGEVKFILYKGNHYHLTVFTDWDEDIFVDTNDVWDDGDRVGITIAPRKYTDCSQSA